MSSYKVLVLGANGMLGKMVSLYLSTNKNFNVEVTTRNKTEFILENFKNNSHILDINQNSLLDIVNNDKFNFIINCIGVIKPKINENDNVSVKETILTNSYFPLSIQNIAKDENIKYIQIGTDCVFSGLAGDHFEDSYKDAEDLYGKSKIVGEIESHNKIVLRSSIIGPESGNGYSLMNWFIRNKDSEVSGYKNHQWNGVTTLNFAKIIEGIIKNNSLDFRTHHLIPANSISKADLLEAFKKYFLKDVKINHINADTLIDRTLKTKNNTLNTTLWKNAGYDNVPTIEENIEELAKSNLSNRIMT
jgi:dTDP-4-dehydrorhamnose reductase|tara:strand:+ start:18397 stop:19308 length:912 start_codon:yes stop_codon:yes gene_type:complete